MKKLALFLFIGLIGVTCSLAQAPQAFKYQTIVRSNSGDLIINQLVSFRIGIVKDSINGTLVYSEIHSDTTNQFGLVSLEIGKGTFDSGVFKDINWGASSHFLQTEIDEIGGTDYRFMGTSQLLSVPYSLNSSSLTLTSPNGTNYEIIVDDNGILRTSCFPMPSVANAGTDQSNAVSPITLEANAPDVGTGFWTIISGTGGNIVEPSNPISYFSGTADSSYTLRWTIFTTCDSTFDDVNISVVASAFQPCPGNPTISDIDGNMYNTIQIGSQCWMAENLKTTVYNNGTTIPNISENDDWSNDTTGAYVWYDNDTSWKDSYGALYNGYTTTDTNGLCPTGWHVPTNDEWTALTEFIGGTLSPHGNELKSCRQVNTPYGIDCNTTEHPRWREHSTHYGTDDYRFSALPGGYRLSDGAFEHVGIGSLWWTSTEDSPGNSFSRNLGYYFGGIGINSLSMKHGFSVRCLKD